MKKIEVSLTDKEYEQLQKVSDILNRETDEVARLVISTGCAWVQQRTEADTPNEYISIMVHSLLGIPKVQVEGEMN